MAQNYHITATTFTTQTKPDYASIEGPPYFDADIVPLQDLLEYVANLHDWVVSIVQTSDAMIRAELRTKVRNHFPLPPPLGATNKIIDDWVNHSRPSGGSDVWAGDPSGFWIHPVTKVDAPNSKYWIAVANPAPNVWVSAFAVAYVVP